MTHPVVILVRPQLGENIGAVARAMGNFGLTEMRLVSPRDGWPNKRAVEVAAGPVAGKVIEEAKVFSSFEDSLSDVQHVYATTGRPRGMEKQVLEPPQAMEKLRGQMAQGWRCALVFGPERTGLENDEVALSDTIISIPTSPLSPSLNLGQATVVVGYEWWRSEGAPSPAKEVPEPAPREEMMGLLAQLEEYLDAVDYYRVADKKPVMWQNVQTMMLRGGWSSQEVRSMRGLLRAIWEQRRMPGGRKAE